MPIFPMQGSLSLRHTDELMTQFQGKDMTKHERLNHTFCQRQELNPKAKARDLILKIKSLATPRTSYCSQHKQTPSSR